MAIIENAEIRKILPHRYPILLVDRIVECNDKDFIVGIKCVAANEPIFQGHFPDVPIMPGVLQLEAMAQTAGILLNRLHGCQGKISYYLGVDKARFRKTIVPGDVMRMEIKLLKYKLNMSWVEGKTLVDGVLACEANMLFGGGG